MLPIPSPHISWHLLLAHYEVSRTFADGVVQLELSFICLGGPVSFHGFTSDRTVRLFSIFFRAVAILGELVFGLDLRSVTVT